MPDSEVSEAARALAARRRVVETACVYCGKPTSGTGKRRYCSPECRWKAAYQRKLAEALGVAPAALMGPPAAPPAGPDED